MPPVRMLVFASPQYFAENSMPETPEDLIKHNCINFRLPGFDGLYTWEFAKDSREINVKVNSQLVFNTSMLILKAAIKYSGIGYLPADIVYPHVETGKLQLALEDWCPYFPGITFTIRTDVIRQQLSARLSRCYVIIRQGNGLPCNNLD